MILDGDENVAETFYLIWELLSLYDGYFYKPKCLKINGEEQDADSLMRGGFYAADSQRMSSPLLGRNARGLSTEIIENMMYFVIRG